MEFWKSKTFWTMVIGLVVYLANELFGFAIPNEWIVTIMALLGILFRWQASGPLSVSSK